MRITFLTLFPHAFDSFTSESIIKRAAAKKKVTFQCVDIRDFAKGAHKQVDDRPYGGGPGMVMQVEPIVRAIKKVTPKKSKRVRVILTSAKGKRFTQVDAHRLAAYTQVIFVCGHYEGVDERVIKYVDEELSIGDYVLTGGELPAAVMSDAIIRLLPNVLGHEESSKDESHEQKGVLEYPQYTRPEVFRRMRVPQVLLSGDHKKISAWRESKRKHV